MNGFAAFLGRSLRGVRLVEFGALMVLLAMVLSVYLAKASAGRERADITSVEQQIEDEQRHLRLLQAEVAHLEEPARLERLSIAAGLVPTTAKRQAGLDELDRVAQAPPAPEKVKVAAASPSPAADSTAQTGAPQ